MENAKNVLNINVFIQECKKECERLNLDPDYRECSIEDSAAGLGDPIIEAKKLVHRTMYRLRLI